MERINDQIKAARKAKGMTQEDLADALHVTRTTVSRWETGSRIPDLIAIQNLSSILDCRFELAEEELAANSAESLSTEAPKGLSVATGDGVDLSSAKTADTPDIVQKVSHHVTRKWTAIGIALLAIAAVLLVLLWPRAEKHKVQYAGDSGKIYHTADYDQVTPNDPEKAYLSISTTVETKKMSYGDHYMYSFKMREENGIGFHIDRIDNVTFFYGGIAESNSFTAEDITGWGDNPEIPPHGIYELKCGVTATRSDGKPNAVSAGVKVYGTDANGQLREFTSFLVFPRKEGSN